MNRSIKLAFGDRKRRAMIGPDDIHISYASLIRTAKNFFPSISNEIDSMLVFYYRDDEGDSIELSTDDELTEAIRIMTQGNRSVYEFKIEIDKSGGRRQLGLASFNLSTPVDRIPPQQNIARKERGGSTEKDTITSNTTEEEDEGDFGSVLSRSDSLELGDIYPVFGDILEAPPQRKGLLHKTAYQSSLPRPRSPAEQINASKISNWPADLDLITHKAGTRRVSQNIQRSGSSESNIPIMPQSVRCSNEIFTDLGLTIIDAAELFLHRGAKFMVDNLYSETFNNYNGAYKLLYETKTIEFVESEMDYLISSQLHGLTQQSLFADIGHLYILLTINALEEEGDTMFATKNFTDASLKYSEALDLSSSHAGCLSSRAACKLAMKDARGCITDATLAISSLDVPLGAIKQYCSNDSAGSLIYSHLPQGGKKLLRLKTLLRRGAAYAQLSLLDEAIGDYRTASALHPKNQALRTHLNQLLLVKTEHSDLALSSQGNSPSPIEMKIAKKTSAYSLSNYFSASTEQ